MGDCTAHLSMDIESVRSSQTGPLSPMIYTMQSNSTLSMETSPWPFAQVLGTTASLCTSVGWSTMPSCMDTGCVCSTTLERLPQSQSQVQGFSCTETLQTMLP